MRFCSMPHLCHQLCPTAREHGTKFYKNCDDDDTTTLEDIMYSNFPKQTASTIHNMFRHHVKLAGQMDTGMPC